MQEWALQKQKKSALLGQAGSHEARKRLILKNKRRDQSMKKNIGE